MNSMYDRNENGRNLLVLNAIKDYTNLNVISFFFVIMNMELKRQHFQRVSEETETETKTQWQFGYYSVLAYVL